jgi:glucosamine-6-phosphate deaminase
MLSSVHICRDYDTISRAVAARIATLIRRKPDAVLGLATGSTPIGVYNELVRLHREEALDFSRVTTFNLDEYYPIYPGAPQSYHRFMREHLFDFINCNNWHVPSGVPRSTEEIEHDCAQYETQIRDAGGLDFQLLGIGRTGHIGFNEPGSALDSRTRLVTLDYLTRTDAAPDFFGLENVPIRAITMGIATITEAREVVIMASGARKAPIVREALEDKITSKVPASLLRECSNVSWFLDEPAASQLKQQAEEIAADDAEAQRRTLIEYSLRDGKSLAAEQNPLATQVLLDLKQRCDDEHFLPREQTVLCLSPHPDDDVICCGATLMKMSERGNKVVVAYGVSGSNAVRDKDVLSLLRAGHARLVSYLEDNAPVGQSVSDVLDDIKHQIFEREPGAPDTPLLRNLKRVVREGEATDACRHMDAQPLFLNLPFYEKRSRRVAISDDDIEIMLAALQRVQPQIVMLTGEWNDPHGTHELCARVFEQAAERYLESGGAPFVRWNYRGAWNEYSPSEADYFSIFGKPLMERKVSAILDHVSQFNPVFPGADDPREFYERARDRNRQSARQLQTLGVLPPSRSFAPIYCEAFQIGRTS